MAKYTAAGNRLFLPNGTSVRSLRRSISNGYRPIVKVVTKHDWMKRPKAAKS